MSLPGYKKKYQPAIWMELPSEKNARQWRDEAKKNAWKPNRRIRARSKHRAAEERLYRMEVRVFIETKQAANVRCPVTGLAVTQCHHIRGRDGILLRDQRGWIAMSAKGHQWVHDHPAEARLRGLLCDLGLWGVPFDTQFGYVAGPLPPGALLPHQIK